MDNSEELKIIAHNTELRFQKLECAVGDYKADIAVIKSKLNLVGYVAGASLIGIIGIIVGFVSHVI